MKKPKLQQDSIARVIRLMPGHDYPELYGIVDVRSVDDTGTTARVRYEDRTYTVHLKDLVPCPHEPLIVVAYKDGTSTSWEYPATLEAALDEMKKYDCAWDTVELTVYEFDFYSPEEHDKYGVPRSIAQHWVRDL